jgi:hypothetical protein
MFRMNICHDENASSDRFLKCDKIGKSNFHIVFVFTKIVLTVRIMINRHKFIPLKIVISPPFVFRFSLTVTRCAGTKVVITSCNGVVRNLVRHLVYLSSYLETEEGYHSCDADGRIFCCQEL